MMRVQKNAFVLITTLFLVVAFAYYSLTIVENKVISTNLNQIKYLHLQAQVHMKHIKEFIQSSSQNQIESFVLDDNRYELKITNIDNNNTKYNITIISKSNIPIRLSEMILK